MKKTTALLLSILYFAFSSGATIHLNYCMGRLVTKTLMYDPSMNCSVCGMEQNQGDGCCSEEIKQLKIDNDQDLPGTEPVAGSGFPIAISSWIEQPSVCVPVLSPRVVQIFIPPPKHTAIFIRNCVFLI
ncbi:MAG: hypothetical protein ACHQFX_14440 [Chitinophagales bacterium]